MDIKTLLSDYYSRAYKRWRVEEEKAGKDIVGEEYEKIRARLYKAQGFTAKSEKIAGYNADLVIRDSKGRILIIEEDKAHYVDSCFLDRFIMNAARVLQHYIDLEVEEEDIPYVVLSCMTKYRLYDSKLQDNTRFLNTELMEMIYKKVKYFPMCEHDRVDSNKYFKSPDVSFDFSDKLIQEQIDFVDALGGVR
jgi:hypothetical protein